MARRGAAKSARSKGAASRPTPVPSVVPSAVPSALNTPLSSAYPSAYPSEDEGDHYVRITADELLLEELSLEEKKTEAKAKAADKPFPFLALPPELRLKVYGVYLDLVSGPEYRRAVPGSAATAAVDLDPDNGKRFHKRLMALLRTCRTVFAEASPFFYGTNTFRLFPTLSYGRISRTRKPLLARLSRRQRACITSLELRVGPGWNKPPPGWVVNPALGLADCVRARSVKVFAEFDPGLPAFSGWRKSDGYYEGFCRNLLDGVLKGLPCVEVVELDAFDSIKLSGGLMQALLGVAVAHGVRITFGPVRGWKSIHDDDAEEDQQPATVSALDLMNGAGPIAVAVAVS